MGLNLEAELFRLRDDHLELNLDLEKKLGADSGAKLYCQLKQNLEIDLGELDWKLNFLI